MHLSFADARQLAIDVLHSHGMPVDHAGIVADHLVDAAGAGHAFAGLPRVMALVQHPYILGAPHRLKYFRQIVELIRARPDVLFWTGAQINDWFVQQAKP